jgi:hypothetical protein
MREYERLAAWDFGWSIHETEAPSGNDFPNKLRFALVPLDGLVDYYANPDEVTGLLRDAGEELVRRYNDLEVKRALEWKDLICRQDWRGKDGRAETTFFEVRVSSYAVHQANMECEERNQDISFSQLKVPSASRRVLLTRLISLLSPPGRDQDGHHLPR